MKHAPAEICGKLSRLGLISKSGTWIFQFPEFTENDLLSNEEYARENCKKLWGMADVCADCGGKCNEKTLQVSCHPSGYLVISFLYFRHKLLNYDGDWWTFPPLKEVLDGEEK